MHRKRFLQRLSESGARSERRADCERISGKRGACEGGKGNEGECGRGRNRYSSRYLGQPKPEPTPSPLTCAHSVLRNGLCEGSVSRGDVVGEMEKGVGGIESGMNWGVPILMFGIGIDKNQLYFSIPRPNPSVFAENVLALSISFPQSFCFIYHILRNVCKCRYDFFPEFFGL